MVMLVLTALGWRLPLRSHMALQALLVGLWVHFGVGPHCRSKVRPSPAAAGRPARCGGATRPLLGACLLAATCLLLLDPVAGGALQQRQQRQPALRLPACSWAGSPL